MLIVFPEQQWLYERASMLCCTYIVVFFRTGFVSGSQKNNLHGIRTGNAG